MTSLPLFKSHYSVGKSILTLKGAEKSVEDGPDSIVDIALEQKMKRVFLVEDSMTGFLEAYRNLLDAKIALTFGLRVTVCADAEDKSEDSLKTEAKYVLMAKNQQGYKDLIKMSSFASTQGFYYQPRIDFKRIKEFWSDNIRLCVPFYDSFLFQNTMRFGQCIPDFSFAKPMFFFEQNGVIFDDYMGEKLKKFIGKEHDIVRTKSIFYKNRKDFIAYTTLRCIKTRGSKGGGGDKFTVDSPNVEHLVSDEFCLESWLEN